MDLVSSIPVNRTPAAPAPSSAPAVQPQAPASAEVKADTVEISKPAKNVEPPKINRVRLFFGVLNNKQIKAINESRMLPKNAKFEMDGRLIANNWCNVTSGTRKLLPGYEVRKNFLGFAVVVPEGSKGLLLRKKPE